MKKTALLSIILFFVMIISPLKNAVSPEDKTALKASATLSVAENIVKEDREENKELTFKILRNKTGKIETVSETEYVIGCVASEIPSSYGKEAIKAQAVAAYTFACRKRNNSKEEYDITDDYTKDQSFSDMQELKTRWGESFEEKYKIISEAVGNVQGETVTYNNEPALTVYHGISPGKTNSCKEVWGSDVPYLSSVDSSFDKMSPDYKTEITLTLEEFFKKLNIKEKSESVKTEKTENGRVIALVCNKTEISGGDAVKSLGLRSGNFDIKVNNENKTVTLTVFGYGHGVGMSQYGADCMAKNGSSYREILLHYYKGCEISRKEN